MKLHFDIMESLESFNIARITVVMAKLFKDFYSIFRKLTLLSKFIFTSSCIVGSALKIAPMERADLKCMENMFYSEIFKKFLRVSCYLNNFFKELHQTG